MRDFSTWGIFSFLFLGIFLFIEIGYLLGQRLQISESNNSAFTTVKGAVLAMVGLLLGFSFAFSSNRFELRRQLMMHEVNAIRTVYMQNDLMEEPLKSEYKQAVKDYLDARIRFSQMKPVFNAEEWQKIQKNEVFQKRVWELGVRYSKEHPEYSNASSITQAITRMTELGIERSIARLSQVPIAILMLLIGSLLIGGLLMGHSFGMEKQRSWLMTFIFTFLLSFVTLIILDLDQPGHGFLKDHQELFLYLRSTLN